VQELLDSHLEVVVAEDFIYMPLLFDPSLAGEIEAARGSPGRQEARGSPGKNHLVFAGGRYFIKSLSLASLLHHFENLHPDAYGRMRQIFLEKHLGFPPAGDQISLDNKLKTIVFEIMPHFLRRAGRLSAGQRLNQEEILGLISEKGEIPRKYYQQARRLLDRQLLRKRLAELEKIEVTPGPLGEGVIPPGELRAWFHQALTGRILEQEKARWRQKLGEGEPLLNPQQAALLLYLTARGSLEIDGFGFSRLGKTEEYLIYKRTGAYALKDFYGRLYLFPDCRVAVSTLGRLRPVVLERYKHPFLRRQAPGQEICLGNFQPPPAFSAAHAITALEQGVNALYYGYDYRRRNGYHSLDRLPMEERLVDFEDLRVGPEHPKISTGEVEIKNAYA
jgi:hypothetical protein